MELSLLIDILQTGDQDAVQNALLEFNREYAQSFFFNAEEREKRKREKLEEFRKMKRKEHFSNSDSDSDSDHSDDPEVKLREKIGELLIDSLSWDLQPCCRLVILEAIRILSRDKHSLAPFVRTDSMRLLARLAGLEATEEGGLLPEASDGEVACEALKCLCNTVYNSEEAQGMAAEEVRLIGGLARCLKADGGAPESGRGGITRFYELRLTFLLTALRLDIRRQLAHQFHGVALLADALETTLGLRWLDVHEVATSRSGEPLPRDVTERAMEILKILFNITFETSKQQVDEEDAALYRHLAAILRYCLLTDSDSKEWTQEFHGHTVNVLVNLPLMCLDVLLMPKVEPGSVEYMGMNMDTVEALLDFMNRRLDRGLKLRESLTPVLNLLTESSRYHRETRKFLRARVLPPLRDVTNRPEVGEALRNKLVRLMTHVNTDVKHCAAEFLFVLCKENVSRFVKYTGYGNAAGLLAARGLLGGGKGDGKYSEEEDTDTEEYKEAKPNINPVTGRVEEKLPNPMDGMTDEQKEYEAMKLVSMFDRLSREQIIQPMGVGCDGKLTPLDETVQQMAEQISFHSDSDMELD